MPDPFARRLQASPLLPRVVPFVIFLGLTLLQGQLGEASRYWVYLAKTLVGAWMIWSVRDLVREARWAFSWEAVVVGIGVCVLWIGLDPWVPPLSELPAKLGIGKAKDPKTVEPLWNPHAQFGDGSALAWLFIVVRILGSSLVVPPLEETFYRSFLYRYIANPKFEEQPLNRWHPAALFATSAVFGFAHAEWLQGFICGMAYQALVLRKGRLGDAMTAHAITNFLLGLWVVARGDWKFW